MDGFGVREFPLFKGREIFESAGFISTGFVDVVSVGAILVLGY